LNYIDRYLILTFDRLQSTKSDVDVRQLSPIDDLGIIVLTCLDLAIKLLSPFSGDFTRAAIEKMQKLDIDKKQNLSDDQLLSCLSKIFNGEHFESIKRLSKSVYSGKTFANAQSEIMKTLDYYLYPSTSCVFIREIFQLFGNCNDLFQTLLPTTKLDQRDLSNLTDFGNIQIELSIFNIDLATTRPSVLAYCAIQNAIVQYFSSADVSNLSTLVPIQYKLHLIGKKILNIDEKCEEIIMVRKTMYKLWKRNNPEMVKYDDDSTALYDRHSHMFVPIIENIGNGIDVKQNINTSSDDIVIPKEDSLVGVGHTDTFVQTEKKNIFDRKSVMHDGDASSHAPLESFVGYTEKSFFARKTPELQKENFNVTRSTDANASNCSFIDDNKNTNSKLDVTDTSSHACLVSSAPAATRHTDMFVQGEKNRIATKKSESCHVARHMDADATATNHTFMDDHQSADLKSNIAADSSNISVSSAGHTNMFVQAETELKNGHVTRSIDANATTFNFVDDSNGLTEELEVVLAPNHSSVASLGHTVQIEQNYFEKKHRHASVSIQSDIIKTSLSDEEKIYVSFDSSEVTGLQVSVDAKSAEAPTKTSTKRRKGGDDNDSFLQRKRTWKRNSSFLCTWLNSGIVECSQ